MANPVQATRILILGGGFGGVYTALHLQKRFKKDSAVEITLVDRDNYFLMTPLLFEAGSGVLEPRHAVTPIRSLLDKARFVEAEVESVDLENRVVRARHSPAMKEWELPYDHLVLSLGGVPNRKLIPGSEHALTFKTLADAIFLRNHIIDLFEQAEVEGDAARKRRLLSFIVIGAGLVGVELLGELTEFTKSLTRTYKHIEYGDLTFHLLEAGPNVMPEMERDLADYAVATLRRRGVHVMVSTAARRIEPTAVELPDDSRLEAMTILFTAGVAPNPLLATLPLAKDAKGRVMVDSTMRSKERPEVWAVGDCAHIPNPADGKPYPPLAQHALREAKVLAGNIASVVRYAKQPRLEPFVYETLGMLASLGHYKGVGRVFKVKIRGFVAWWVWRTYYLMQMPRWERRVRIMLDWTVALFFRHDVAKLDLFGVEHPVVGRGGEKKTEYPTSNIQLSTSK
jgi:NADH dehydrogenase